MNNKQKILVIYPAKTSIVRKELLSLDKHFDITTYHFDTLKGFSLIFGLVKEFFFLLLNIKKFDKVYIFFAQYYAVFPAFLGRIFNIKVYIMVGGTDAHKFPEFNYGNFAKFSMKIATCISLKLCYKIFPKHESLIASNYTYDKIKNTKQGYANLCNDNSLIKKSIVIENGYDTMLWENKLLAKKNIFLTVGSGFDNYREFTLKGIDLITAIADYFPEYQFVIVGGEGSLVKKKAANIIFLPATSQENLHSLYNEAKFYLQLSMAEGFPNALCEAMLCECVPIGSSVFGIPDIIADTGYILPHKEIALLKSLIETAIAENKNGKFARERIINNFSVEKRDKHLIQALYED